MPTKSKDRALCPVAPCVPGCGLSVERHESSFADGRAEDDLASLGNGYSLAKLNRKDLEGRAGPRSGNQGAAFSRPFVV
jgi:hypothetical protein